MANFSDTVPNRELIEEIMVYITMIDSKIEKHEVTRKLGPSRGPLWLNQELRTIKSRLYTLLSDCTDYYG